MDDGNTRGKRRYSSAHAVYALKYHIVFCPKYRRKVLGPLEEELKELFTQKATELGLEILAMEVMPDHVHIFIEGKPSYEPQFIVNQLKGYTDSERQTPVAAQPSADTVDQKLLYRIGWQCLCIIDPEVHRKPERQVIALIPHLKAGVFSQPYDKHRIHVYEIPTPDGGVQLPSGQNTHFFSQHTSNGT